MVANQTERYILYTLTEKKLFVEYSCHLLLFVLLSSFLVLLSVWRVQVCLQLRLLLLSSS